MTALVIALHGIGNQRAGWSNALEDGVRKHLAPGVRVRWAEVSYADLNAEVLDDLWLRLTKPVPFAIRTDPTALRRFVFSHLADALRMEEYQQRAFERLDRELVDGEPTNVVLVSHSLGTVLGVRWLTSRGRRIDGLVTLGSPLPLFPDPPPNATVMPHWVNCYDPIDPIGCPLLPAGYPVHEDVSVGNPGRWIPALRHLKAHVNYDQNRDVHRRIAKLL